MTTGRKGKKMSKMCDDATTLQALNDMKKVAELGKDIGKLRAKLESSKELEERKQIKDKIKAKDEEFKEIVKTFPEKYGVETAMRLSNELRNQGVSYKESQSQEGQTGQNSGNTTNNSVTQKGVKEIGSLESGSLHMKNVEDALRRNNHEASQRESAQKLGYVQTTSQQLYEGNQRLREVDENKDNSTHTSQTQYPHELSSPQELCNRADNMDTTRLEEKARGITISKDEENVTQSDSSDKGHKLTFREKLDNAKREFYEIREQIEKEKIEKEQRKGKGKTMEM